MPCVPGALTEYAGSVLENWFTVHVPTCCQPEGRLCPCAVAHTCCTPVNAARKATTSVIPIAADETAVIDQCARCTEHWLSVGIGRVCPRLPVHNQPELALSAIKATCPLTRPSLAVRV